MTAQTGDTIFYENRRGIRVTAKTLSTRYKDEALAPIQSVQIGREPLLIGLVLAAGLGAFAWQFGDLLFDQERDVLAGTAAVILLLGWIVTPFRVGLYNHERTVFWCTLWTARAVRRAIARARATQAEPGAPPLIAE